MSMTNATDLYWLPEDPDWRAKVKALGSNPDTVFSDAVSLANARLDFNRTNALDERCNRLLPAAADTDVRLAVLGSSTLAHLHSAIRVAGLRRNLRITTYENDYGQYYQELLTPKSGLHRFLPNTILFAFDARHVTQGANASLTAADAEDLISRFVHRTRQCWAMARTSFNCKIVQQTVLDTFPHVLGQNEYRLPGSRSGVIAVINARLREAANEDGVDVLAMDDQCARYGLTSWYDPGLWHRTKQEITPKSAPLYGDLVARLVASQRGLSKKCLVLDLDNTLWGGVIGDDGLSGIVLGQGSGEGESFVAIQEYARELSRRGVILAVCSKNTEEIAWTPFDQHSETVLKRSDISCFIANWSDKAGNIRSIAKTLNIGLDSLVFLDDNPFERNLVRQELPMVSVPEFTDDPAFVPQLLADAGYFEAAALTEEDRARTQQYQSNMARAEMSASSTDLEGYLRDLDMTLLWQRFEPATLGRTTQLINKTNQFNLTTRRYTDAEVSAIISDPNAFGVTFQLLDRFGDNGIISVVIGRLVDDGVVDIDTWLMSCRVLGRQVERATLAIVAAEARRLGAGRLSGRYIPTAKNDMVREHYINLGFADLTELETGTIAYLDLDTFQAESTYHMVKGPDHD